MSKRRVQIFIFLVALISVGSVHYTNRLFLLDSAPELLRDGITVQTSDDASYLAPVKNFLEGKGWKSNAVGDAAYTTRSPGYGLIYLIFRVFSSERIALILLMAFQFLVFAFAVSRIPEIAKLLSLPAKWGILIALFIALMPTFSGFLSYTLTEGVTPALVVLFLYRLSKAQNGSMAELAKAVLILSFLILVRPAMLIWTAAPMVLLWKNESFPQKTTLYFSLLLAFVPLFLWQVWASAKTESWVGLHSIYHSDSNDLYRPIHSDIWNFHKSWGQKGVDFHRGMTALWQDALEGASPNATVDTILKGMDTNAVEETGVDNLRNSYLEYYEILSHQASFFKERQPMPGITIQEARLSSEFQAYRSEYVSHHFFYSNIVVPIEVYWRLAGHSNLSLYMFQRPLRGKSLMEVFRYFSFFIYCGTFVIFPFVVLLFFRNRKIQMLGLPILLYLGYLCIVQRGIEERYSAPVLIPMFLVVLFALHWLLRNRISLKNSN